MLNKMKFALAGTIAAASLVSGAANAATETANAEAEILTPVALSAVTDLDFGLIAGDADGGTVALPTASDTRSCTGVICVGTATRASFQVTNATQGQVVALSVPTTGVALSGPGANMPVSLALSNASITFNSAALQTVYIGGTLTVGANQAAGVYSTTFPVTADYQ
ncbi:DUF4402 domain-containing protein [Sphingorhabdus arenilitoris]|uniref:DUF4402 domain-containing protein n=1 Tax=Sphingorhabdus arenilitoris TaxID=1490041 RepID=A0ABV8REE1_9SPHN